MGRGQKRGRTQRRHFKQSRENVWKYNNKKERPGDASHDDPGANSDPNANPSSNPSWQPFATQNAAFEEYYKEQGIVPVEEWDEFISVIRKPLPAAFRINASGQFFQDMREQLENDFVKSLEADVTNEYEEEAIRPLPWYPGNLAWHLNYSRMQLRKNQTLERFHEFLKQENEIGNITRQEAVSMVPPLFLDVLPDHHVLDMCAAPGSKTFQLLEMMHQSTEIGSLPSGMVIANDVDVQRCNLLIHQTKRMCSANLIVTNHEAQHFPSCHLLSICPEISNDVVVGGELTSDCTSGIDEPMNSKLLFDRVLCDVPCSGDGTLRKAPDIWRKWHSGNGNGLHNLQVLIAMRGLALLKVGGRMVYSTCSMNPVENEAVVSEILSRCGQSVELLDVSSELPSLKRRPGLKKWKVRDKGLWLSSYSEVAHNRKSTILPSMFPSGRTSTINGVSSDNVEIVKHETENGMKKEAIPVCPNLKNDSTTLDNKDECSTREMSEVPDLSVRDANNTNGGVSSLPLERCIRILPHDQNSGAFFIAVFRKISPLHVVPDKRHNSSSQLNATKNRTLPAVIKDDASKHKEDRIQEDVQNHCLELANSGSNPIDEEFLMETEVVAVNHNGASSSSNGIEGAKKIIAMKDGQEGEKATKGKLQTQGRWRGIDPVVFFEDKAAIKSIIDFYGIQSSFPLNHHLVSRNEDASHVKRIYYISKSVQDILNLNFKVGQRLRIASLGLKMFERQTSKDGSSPCAFRISSEGLPLLLPHIAKQILYATLTDFQHLLQYRNIKFAEFVDADFREQATKLLHGCCVVVLNKGADVVMSSTIAIVCWRGKASLSVMVSEMDGREMLERLCVRFGAGKTGVSGDETPTGDTGLGADHGDYESNIDAEELLEVAY